MKSLEPDWISILENNSFKDYHRDRIRLFFELKGLGSIGRPKEKVSNRNTQDDNFGKDRLGAAGMKKDYNDTNKSPLALESNSNYLQHQNMLKSIPSEKKLVFEQDNAKSSLLDESNIKEQ